MRKQKGFSLIELLIVVAIILIIAAIAIPNLLTSRMAANEASAVGSMRTINTSEITYASSNPGTGFTSLAMLGSAAGGNLLDNVLGCSNAAGCTKSGYLFLVTPAATTPVGNYDSTATASAMNSTGRKDYYSNASGVIRAGVGSAVATSADSAIQ